MLKVFFTVDVEIWLGGWDRLDERFPEAFRRYVYGETRTGDWGLPRKLRVLNDHGLRGVFFVEPLFALRFGAGPLAEIVGLIREAGQEVQMHLHTEWADEARVPVLEDHGRKRQFLYEFAAAEQLALLREGRRLLAEAGATGVCAFRAGSFGMNLDTLAALAEAGIAIDSSYDYLRTENRPELGRFGAAHQPFRYGGVVEYPMTVYRDGGGGIRHLQLGACSSAEIESVLLQGAAAGWGAAVMLSHNFELLNPAKDAADAVVVARYLRLARFLERRRDLFETAGFAGLAPAPVAAQPPLARAGLASYAARTAEQAWRRLRYPAAVD